MVKFDINRWNYMRKCSNGVTKISRYVPTQPWNTDKLYCVLIGRSYTEIHILGTYSAITLTHKQIDRAIFNTSTWSLQKQVADGFTVPAPRRLLLMKLTADALYIEPSLLLQLRDRSVSECIGGIYTLYNVDERIALINTTWVTR